MNKRPIFFEVVLFAAMMFFAAGGLFAEESAAEGRKNASPANTGSVIGAFFLAPGAAPDPREIERVEAAGLLRRVTDELASDLAAARASKLTADPPANPPETITAEKLDAARIQADASCERLEGGADDLLASLRFETVAAQYAEALRKANEANAPLRSAEIERLRQALETGEKLRRLLESAPDRENVREMERKESTNKESNVGSIKEKAVEFSYCEALLLLRLAKITDDQTERTDALALARTRLGEASAANENPARVEQIRTALRQAVEMPEQPSGNETLSRAKSLYRAGKVQEAVDRLVERLRVEPNDFRAKLLLCDMLADRKEEAAHRRALTLASSVVENAPEASVEWFEAKERVIRLCLALGERTRAEKIAAMLTLAHPDCGDSARKARIEALLHP